MKRDLLARRAASAALAACMMFTLSAPALAAAPALPEFYSAAKVLEQTNDAETAVSNEFSLSNGRLYIVMTGNDTYEVTQNGTTTKVTGPLTVTGTISNSSIIPLQFGASGQGLGKTAHVTLKNVNITYNVYNGYALKVTDSPLELTLEGENSLTATGKGGSGIYATQNIAIKGSGKLNISGPTDSGYGIFSYYDIDIEDTTVTTNGGNTGILGCSSVTIKNSTVKAEGRTRGIYSDSAVKIADSTVKANTVEGSTTLTGSSKVLLTKTPSSTSKITTTALDSTGWLAYADGDGYTCIAPENGKLPSSFNPNDFSTYDTADVVPSSEYDLANGAISVVVTGENIYRVTQNGTTTEKVPGPVTITGTAPGTLDGNAVHIDATSGSDATAQIILKNVNAASSKNALLSYCALELTLEGENSLTTTTGSNYYSGLFAAGNLTITGSGKLNAFAPAEGSAYGISSWGISTIENTTVTATGGIYNVNDLILKNSTVSATGYNRGISGGSKVRISGGNVEAKATNPNTGDSYGIFGGTGVTIDGGAEVTANAPNTTSTHGICGASSGVSITGSSTVTAYGKEYGIRSGSSTVSISGSSTVNAIATDTGSDTVPTYGICGERGVTIENSNVTANDPEAPGQYGIYGGSATVKISGGTVKASSSLYGIYAYDDVSISDGASVTVNEDVQDGTNIPNISSFGTINITESTVKVSGIISGYSSTSVTKSSVKANRIGATQNTKVTDSNVKAGSIFGRDIDLIGSSKVLLGQKPDSSNTSVDTSELAKDGSGWLAYPNEDGEITCAAPEGYELPSNIDKLEPDQFKPASDAGGSTECEHSYQWKTDSEYHWQECSKCSDIQNKTKHTYDQTDADGKLYQGEEGHWYKCECGRDGPKTAHEFDEDGVCAVCGYEQQSPDQPGDDDIITPAAGGSDAGGAVAAVAIGGAAILGGYEVATRVILHNLLPEGAAIPANRGQLALLVWNTAGRPEPVSAPTFVDVADPDMAKAAQWCTEQGIMDAKGDRFEPEGWTPKFKVIEVWNKAFPKQ